MKLTGREKQIQIKASLDFLESFKDNNSHKIKKMKLKNQEIAGLKRGLFAAMGSIQGATPDKAREIATQAITDLKKKLSGVDTDKRYLDALTLTLNDNIAMSEKLQKEAQDFDKLSEDAARLQKEELIQPFHECLKIAVGILDEQNQL